MGKFGHLIVGEPLDIIIGGVLASVVFVAMVGDPLSGRPVVTSVERTTVMGRPRPSYFAKPPSPG